MQFLCSLNWLRSPILSYNTLVAPLQDLLQQCLRQTDRRSSKQAAKISLQPLWTASHTQNWECIRAALLQAVQLSHLKSTHTVNVFSDASDTAWAVVVTQTPPDQDSLAIIDRDHEPLAFLSSVFKGSQVRWPTVEKEAFAVVEGISRLEYLLIRERGFHLYTDHHNLTYIFRPQALGVSKRSSLDRLARWSISLSAIPNCIISLIARTDNVWADLLTRWGSASLLRNRSPAPVSAASHDQDHFVCRAVAVCAPDSSFSIHSSADDWPSISDIRSSQMRPLQSKTIRHPCR